MTWKTHIFGGIQAGIIFAAATNADARTAFIEVSAAALGSILPDIDQPNSKISRSDIALKFTAGKLSKITKHRREVHTVWASLIFGAITALFLLLASSASVTGLSFLIGLVAAVLIDLSGAKIGIPMGIILFFLIPRFIKTPVTLLNPGIIFPVSAAVFCGCISHLIYDTMNVQGIMWLHPFKKKRYRLSTIRTESKEEGAFRLLMVLLTTLLVVVLQPFGSEYMYEIIQNIRGVF